MLFHSPQVVRVQNIVVGTLATVGQTALTSVLPDQPKQGGCDVECFRLPPSKPTGDVLGRRSDSPEPFVPAMDAG